MKHAFRNLRKNGKYTLINFIGMTVGMACCFLILTYLRYEQNFDTFFPKGDRLYRIGYHADFSGEPLDLNRVPAPMGPAMPDEFPQVESVARLFPRSVSVRNPKSDKQFEIGNTLFADSTVQEVLGLDFLHGDPATALSAPFSVVLTDETALRLFGTDQVMGRPLRIGNESVFTVSGVVQRLPRQSHLEFEMLLPFRNIPDAEPASSRAVVTHVLNNNWLASYAFTYVILKKGTSQKAANALFPEFIKKYGHAQFKDKQKFSLFKVRDIHQYSTAGDAGRDFDKSFGTDHLNRYILNELAVKTLGWSNPEEAIGQNVVRGGKQGKVVGVVNNFNTAGLQVALNPVILDVSPGRFTAFAIRLKSKNTQAVTADIEKAWRQFFPEKAFDYTFLNDDLHSGYEQEARLMQLSADFAGIAIVLACFGLFGLVDFTVRQRRKEIGVRKVLGASVTSVVGLLSKDFLKLVGIALLLATPVAYWAMSKWLADFAYRIDIQWWIFVVAGIAAAAVAFLTMASQRTRAALENPVRSLRSE